MSLGKTMLFFLFFLTGELCFVSVTTPEREWEINEQCEAFPTAIKKVVTKI
jgi:hypothetical protein